MTLLFSYGLRNLGKRKLTTALTAGGMALVTFVFAAVLMLAEGLEKTLIETGSPDNAVVLRAGAEAEISSAVARDEASIITTQPEVDQDRLGQPIAAKESMILVALPKSGSETPTNVAVRGVGPHSLKLRSQVKLVAGRNFRPGTTEVIAGSNIAERIRNASLGETLRFALTDWKVVGVFDAGTTGFDSEVWGDANQLMAAFHRNNYSAVILKVPGSDAFEELKTRLERDPRLSVQVKREIDFYRDQSDLMARFIRILGTAMTMFFSVGAILGAMVTMYSSVAHRTREIGTLRALGFKKWGVLSAFLAESLFLGLAGGAVGIACGSLLQFLTISTINWETFSELAFRFRLTPAIAGYTLGFATFMGISGGFLPSWRAARLKIVDALRAS